MRRSFCLISLATIMLECIGKVGSIALSGVQKLFCMIFRSRYISILKWGIRSPNVWILDNLSVLKSDIPYCFTFILAPFFFYRNGLELSVCLISMYDVVYDSGLAPSLGSSSFFGCLKLWGYLHIFGHFCFWGYLHFM